MFNANLLAAASTAALTLAVVFAPQQASAAAITINSTAPSWTNVVGGTNVNTDTAFGGPNTVTQVFWGTPAEIRGDQSGLGFNPSNSPAITYQTGTSFLLGTLTHYNEPISTGTAATSARLNLITTIAGAVPSSVSFSYRFNIDETPNSA
ncbi:MAG: conserved repeat domain, partial [Rubritepida sp.]|nr:conserved repeat domain [Rubritepida sp.]